ncbi:hypothetical protein J6590_013294 [Homalodisca vitripennis]|nr:hypothetical protein J6590_013294 [Homalodisca vitripennis]
MAPDERDDVIFYRQNPGRKAHERVKACRLIFDSFPITTCIRDQPVLTFHIICGDNLRWESTDCFWDLREVWAARAAKWQRCPAAPPTAEPYTDVV